MIFNMSAYQRSLEYLKPFMERQLKLSRFQFFIQNIYYIQKKLRNALVNKDGKLDVLLNYWEKILFEMQIT